MPNIRIKNLTNSSIGVGDAIGVLQPRQGRVIDVSVSELESARSTLVSLEQSGRISWSVESTLDSSDDKGEYLPLSNSATKTSTRLDLYVDAATGKDSNPGTQAAPLATLVEAERRIPDVINYLVVLNVYPHTGNGYTPPTFRSRLMRNHIVMRGVGDNTLVAADTVTSTSDVLVTGSAGLGVDTYRGKTIEILTGVAAGDRRTIRDHTDDTIIPVVAFSDTVSAGDTFRIFEPSVKIDYTSNKPLLFEGNGNGVASISNAEVFFEVGIVKGICLSNLLLDSGASNDIEIESRGQVYFWGVEATANVAVYLLGCQYSGSFISGYEYILEEVSTGMELGAPGSRSWLGWGLSNPDISLAVVYADFFGTSCSDKILSIPGNVHIRGGSSVSVGGIDVFQGLGSNVRETPPNITVDSNMFLVSDIRSKVVGKCSVEGPSSLAYFADCDLDGNGGVAIECLRGAYARVRGNSTIVNSTVGLQAGRGGRITFGNGLTVTTSSSDTAITTGAAPTQALGSYSSNGSFINALDGTVIQRDD